MQKQMTSAIQYLDNTAQTMGDRTAIEDAGDSVTFSQLRARAEAVASQLLARGLTGRNIAVLLPKKICAVVSFFGCLYSANTYVPLDYRDAKERLCTILSKIDAPLVITDRENADWLRDAGAAPVLCDDLLRTEPDRRAIDEALRGVCDLSPIYIMHTSGSTGEPKGVVVPHRGVIDFIDWVTSYMKLDENSVIALQSPFHFDASVFDLYSCIAVGAKLVIMPDILTQFPAKIPDFLEENRITCIFWVPGVLAEIANAGVLEEHKMPELAMFTFVGEVMPTKQLNQWIRANPNREYINLYGPTEASVACCAYRIRKKLADTEPIPIGRPSANTRILLLNEANEEASPGETGEICIAGSGLALGYYGKKEQTDAVFVQNPLNSSYQERIYRTGDYGYQNSDGDLVFAGRRDSQVKLHGIRVELGDIENAACCLAGVERACVTLDESGRTALFLQTKQRRSQRQLKQLLKEYLPKYMIPDNVYEVELFPLNQNGKIDRKKLMRSVSAQTKHQS